MSERVASGSAERFLRDGIDHDRAGRMAEARSCYEAAIKAAEQSNEQPTLAEALRRLGIVHHLCNEPEKARQLCNRSRELADQIGDRVLSGEALNVLASFDLERGDLETADEMFRQALLLGKESAVLRGRVEQNLGVLENVRGNLTRAMDHYHRSLTAFTRSGHERGQAIAYHNLGMISADKAEWDDADQFFRQATARAEELGDQHLRALCLLNHCEVFIARQNYASAKQHAEAALQVLTQIGDQAGQSAAYRFLGMIYRETDQKTLAEVRLKQSLELSRVACSPLDQAEALRELAFLFLDQGRSTDTLKTLNESRRLFRRLDAKLDRVDVVKKIAELEHTFMEVVRDWGVSIESADSYTHGHCERVASYAAELANRLGLSPTEQTTVRVGAYLHDLGKVNVPHEILNKPGPLTEAEFEIIKKHPMWGLEMLALVDFPWDIKPIIRWHHEKVDGSGYPDGLSGDAIPLDAQIICIADTFDAMTTKRSYRDALSRDEALAELETCRHWWFPEVYEAFLASIEANRTKEPCKYLRMKLALND